MKEFNIISNTCVGYWVNKILYPDDKTPFGGSLFMDDEQYLKLCENYEYYTSLEPTFGEAKNDKWLKDFGTRRFRTGIVHPHYVVMFLDDIEINWIHETSEEFVKNQFKSRIENSKKYQRIFLWCDAEIFNICSEDERNVLVERFNKIDDISIFLTKHKHEEFRGDNTIVHFIPEWENKKRDERTTYFVPFWGDQIQIGTTFKEIIETL